MSSRSRAAANPAWLLNHKLAVDVRVSWDNPSGRPRDGARLVQRTDGPTVDTVRSHTEDRHETTCTACGAPNTPRGVGRPARHCSPACRTPAWPRATGQPR